MYCCISVGATVHTAMNPISHVWFDCRHLQAMLINFWAPLENLRLCDQMFAH